MTRHANARLEIGPLSNGGTGKHAPVKRIAFEPSERHVNANQTEPLNVAAIWAGSALRPGCMDAYRLPSKGMGC